MGHKKIHFIQLTQNITLAFLLLRMGHYMPLFLNFCLFNTVDSKCSISIFANGWIRTSGLWNQKQPLYQLSHNHCPNLGFFNLNKTQKKSFCCEISFVTNNPEEASPNMPNYFWMQPTIAKLPRYQSVYLHVTARVIERDWLCKKWVVKWHLHIEHSNLTF